MLASANGRLLTVWAKPGDKVKLVISRIVRHGSLLLVCSLGVLAGCATSPPAFPKSERVSLHVSSDTVSTWTETAAQDHLIPDSQVFVSGRGSSVMNYFGLVGVGINQSMNANAVASDVDALRLGFAGELQAALKANVVSAPASQKYRLVDSPQQADAVLLPSAKLTVTDDNSAQLSFRLTVRFRDAVTHAETKKEYFYLHGDRRSISGSTGWAAEKASPMKAAAAQAFAQLSNALRDDMDGLFGAALLPDKQVIVEYRVLGSDGRTIRAVLLKEYPEHLVVVPIFRDQPARGVVSVVEKGSVTR